MATVNILPFLRILCIGIVVFNIIIKLSYPILCKHAQMFFFPFLSGDAPLELGQLRTLLRTAHNQRGTVSDTVRGAQTIRHTHSETLSDTVRHADSETHTQSDTHTVRQSSKSEDCSE